MITLYAKSPPRRPDGSFGTPPTLDEHTISVCDSAAALLGERHVPTRLARSMLRFLKLTLADFDLLWLNTMIAAALHDIGKANDGFQAAVGNPAFPRGEQAVRHEHLSAMWIANTVISKWLCTETDAALDHDLVVSAVATHHLKARRDSTAAEVGFAGATSIRSQCQGILGGIRGTLAVAGQYLGKQPPDLSQFPLVWKPGASADRDALVRRADLKIGKDLASNERRRRLLLGMRATLIAADAAGSGLVREGQPIEWIRREVIANAPLSARDIWNGCDAVIDCRIAQLEKQGKWNRAHGRDGWSDFQDASANLGRRALLLAACGAGKTLAAWRWIEATLRREEHAGRAYGRVLFLYPTRGTATEGFRDYVSWAPESDAALVHGTAAYDLADLFTNPEDERSKKHFNDEKNARLFALAQWPKRIFSATVDSFLGAMSNQYGPVCLLPVLADSVVVIDEVHSFSESMFAALRCLLERFDVPVLCMTASLPTHRRVVLEKLGLELFPRSSEQFEDLSRASDHRRYRVYGTTREDAERIAEQKLSAGKRVLWVVNRVDECQYRYRRMKATAPVGVPVLCYHSRFRLCDRRDRHREVVEEFQRKDRRAALAVTTQVCEMSLDLDADVLISEIAPVTAQIQRMGRCCREKDPGDRFGDVYLYEPAQTLPYERAEIDQGKTFRDELANETTEQLTDKGAVSQNRLSEKLMALAGQVEPQRYTAFWDSGFWAFPTEFREGDEFTIDCVLRTDVSRYLVARNGRRSETPGYIVPVPRKLLPMLQVDSRLHPLMVAPDELYDKQVGYFLPEVSNGEEN